MINSEFGKTLLPLVSVVVILQSVVLVNSIRDKRNIGVQTLRNDVDTTVARVSEAKVFDMVFGVDSKSMVVGKKYAIDLSLLSKEQSNVGSVEIYVKYDPSAFEVSNLSYDGKLQKPDVLIAGEKKGLVVANYYSLNPAGFAFNEAEHYSLVMFDVKPKKEGSFDFEISTGNAGDGSATMILDNNTKKELLYSSNKLTVNVTK